MLFRSLDMLRYDSCFPRNGVDASKLADILLYNKREDVVTINIARFMPYKHLEPTKERWESFGWKVSAVETVKK